MPGRLKKAEKAGVQGLCREGSQHVASHFFISFETFLAQFRAAFAGFRDSTTGHRRVPAMGECFAIGEPCWTRPDLLQCFFHPEMHHHETMLSCSALRSCSCKNDAM